MIAFSFYQSYSRYYTFVLLGIAVLGIIFRYLIQSFFFFLQLCYLDSIFFVVKFLGVMLFIYLPIHCQL